MTSFTYFCVFVKPSLDINQCDLEFKLKVLPNSYIAIFTQCILSDLFFYPLIQFYNLSLYLIYTSFTRPHVSNKAMNSHVLNYMETNPWSTNSNALAIVLMESIFTKNYYRHSLNF